jgi:hypothetical protein
MVQAMTRAKGVPIQAVPMPGKPMPTIKQLFRWLEGLKDEALEAAEHEGDEPTIHTALLVRDTLMACLMILHTSLAQRPSLLMYLKAPQHAHTPCHLGELDCPIPNCKGNSITRLAGGAYQLVISHHKMDRTTRGMVLDIQVGMMHMLMYDVSGITLVVYVTHVPTISCHYLFTCQESKKHYSPSCLPLTPMMPCCHALAG